MKRDLSQSFRREPHSVFLLIENSKTHEFALRYSKSDDDYYDAGDNYWIPRIDVPIKAKIPAILIEVAREHGVSLERFREIDRDTVLLYSFTDKTRGTMHDTICLHLIGDPIDGVKPDGVIFANSQKVLALLEDTWGPDFELRAIKMCLERSK
jgi:hypothetical protein